MSSSYAQESSGSGRQGGQAASAGSGARQNATVATGHRAVNTSDIDACARDNTHSGYGGHNISSDKYGRDTSFDRYSQTMCNDPQSRGSASGNISASNMGTSAGTGETGSSSAIGAGHRGGDTYPVTTGVNSGAGIRPPQYRGRLSNQGHISADASANDGTSYDDSSHQSQMHQHGATQDDFIGECHQPGCATCWSTGHYDDSAAAADPVNMNTTATGHRTIGHHTTDRHPIGHHADTSAMGGGSWGAGNMGSGEERMADNATGDTGKQVREAQREARVDQAPIQN